ncbi:hypothetical protein PIB30_023178 [Stylosanthes scabra]|uniref:Uncharacterized protein n=1 Tax=Stylosanthes scabra TaxID=79078 RepID=A0ABU6UBG0_9FABA|nr:hypothetical protein [Stylosanthes scabra]
MIATWPSRDTRKQTPEDHGHQSFVAGNPPAWFTAASIGVSRLPTSLVREFRHTFEHLALSVGTPKATPMNDHSDISEDEEHHPGFNNTSSHSAAISDADNLDDDFIDPFPDDYADDFVKNANSYVTQDYSPQLQEGSDRPFVGLRDNQGKMMQEIRHRMREMERRLQNKLARKNRHSRSRSREHSHGSSRRTRLDLTVEVHSTDGDPAPTSHSRSQPLTKG